VCTLIAIKGVLADAALVVGANRDELYARRSVAPRKVQDEPIVVAGIDREKGGTWMGANERGLFVALTNQREHHPPDRSRASRGEVVLEALSMEDVESVDELLASLDPSDFNGFNLLYGSAADLRVAYSRPDEAAIEVESLGDGVWVLPNDRIGSPHFPKSERALALLESLLERDLEGVLAGLPTVLGDHERPDASRVPAAPPGSRFDAGLLRILQALCIHTPIYGTRSSTLLALGEGRVERYLFADGPPCMTPFRDVTPLLST